MNRRTFVTGTTMAIAIGMTDPSVLLAQSTPVSSPASEGEYPELLIVVNDTDYVIPQPRSAARYRVTVRNDGTQPSHAAMGMVWPETTMDDFMKMGEDSMPDVNGHNFSEIGFVGLPDWPAPGGAVTGVVDFLPGNYVIFDPIGSRNPQMFAIDKDFAQTPEPSSDLTVELAEMSISFPVATMKSGKQTWKVINNGALIHELVVMPVSDTLTEDQVMQLFMLPEDATPSPGMPTLDFDPKAAMGMLRPQAMSWIDVNLPAGRYLALCMVPIPGPLPHAMEGMMTFFVLT